MDFPDAATVTAIAAAAGVVTRWLGRKERKELKELREAQAGCLEREKTRDAREQVRDRRFADATASMIETIVRLQRSSGVEDDTGVHRLLEHKRELLQHARHEPQQVVVLLVDDDAAARRSIHRSLEAQGFRVTSAAGVETALAELEGAHYDVAIADLLMPGQSGIDLLRRMRADYPNVRVILISGEERLGAALAGAEGVRFLAKPFTGAALAAMIADALENP